MDVSCWATAIARGCPTDRQEVIGLHKDRTKSQSKVVQTWTEDSRCLREAIQIEQDFEEPKMPVILPDLSSPEEPLQ